ncbi:MAG TPA: thioredoxin family protein [Chitinophagales bacterium]|nr:thioredoxin family protein [Chitinophagales bacterium]HRK28427.1 thioredoxin family protein [Chitinophagales bacterium]
MPNTHPLITPALLKNALSYNQYLQLTDELLAQNKTTGSNHSEPMVNYTRKNRNIIDKVQNSVSITQPTRIALTGVSEKMIWLVLAEAWCGDVAINLPIIKRMADQNPLIELRILLRDEHPLIMDDFLGEANSRAIPKLICLDARFLTVLGTWGPRPDGAQAIMRAYKANPTQPYMDVVTQLMDWYEQDNGEAIQQEFTALLPQWTQTIAVSR